MHYRSDRGIASQVLLIWRHLKWQMGSRFAPPYQDENKMKEVFTVENVALIQGTELQIKEYQGNRVVTFKDVDRVHQRPDGTARRRFNDNRRRFLEGTDFFKITPSEFRTAIGDMDLRQQNNVTLLTESGYLMLVKSFTDDLAWKVQRDLVNTYFKMKEVVESATPEETGMVLTQEGFADAVHALTGCASIFQSMLDYSTINYKQQQELLQAARRRVSHLLGGAHSDRYRQSSRIYFRNLWQDFCEYFSCGSYRDLNPQYMVDDAAARWISEWSYG